MTAGYAAFQTNLKIKGTTKVSSNWNVLITNVTESNKEGDAETVGTPSWTELTAYMEANLYQKGDFVEYDVTVENRGTLDAKLDSIKDNIKSSNEAVKITFSGYTKGEKLEKGKSQIIKVRVEYNPEFNGTIEEGSGEISIDLNYTQNNDYTKDEGGEIISPDRYLVTYDCTTNGGNDCTSYNEYLKEGEAVNLLHQGTNNKHKFIGWNTNKDALEGLTELQMETENITLYAIYEKDPIIRSWTDTDTTDFHSGTYKQSIISAEFLDNKNIPENAVESWDVSAAKDGSVMAWVVPDTADSTKYHLYIGGNGGVIANENSSYMFYNFTNIQSIEFNENFDTSNVTNMGLMFAACNSISEINLDSFNTSKVTDMSEMFSQCWSLSHINLNNFNTENVNNMSGMFCGCVSLTELNLSSFNTNNVTNMYAMFSMYSSNPEVNYMGQLKHIYFGEKFNTENVTTMHDMFAGCRMLTKLNLCNFDTSKVTDMYTMFNLTERLENVYVGSKWTEENANTKNMWLNSKISSVTKSNNCMIDAEDPATINLSTTKTTNSITIVTNATSESGISKYEYSIDGGNTWVTGNGNTYTFSGLKSNTAYNIKVRVTSKIGKQTTSENVTVTTNTIESPTFSVNTAQTQTTITYPEGCGSTYTCTYKYNDKEEVEVTNSSITVPIDQAGNIVAKVTDGTNTVSSSYIVLYNDLYVSSNGNNSTGYGTKEKPYATLNKAYTMATNTASIKVMDDITQTETFTLTQDKDITLTSYSENNSINSIIRESSFTSYLIDESKGTLTFKNIKINGNEISTEVPMIKITNNAYIETGTLITKAKNTITTDIPESSGAIAVDGGTLTMDAGEISYNTTASRGGGIRVDNNGTFIMNGGTISNNTAAGNGGGIRTKRANFVLNGGTISNNSSPYGGGVYINYNATINGGTISNNTATMYGGGVYINSDTTTIKNGTIDNNTSANKYENNFYQISGSKVVSSNNNYTSGHNFKYIVTALNNNYALDVTGSATANGTNIQLYSKANTSAQKWKILPYRVQNGVVSYYIKTSLSSNMMIDVEGQTSIQSGANVELFEFREQEDFYWRLEDAGSGYYYISTFVNSKLCMDVAGAQVANQTNIQVYNCNNSNAQKWKFVEVN